MPDLERLLRTRLATLYRLDGRGRLVTVNEWEGPQASRFHLMSTPFGALAAYRNDTSDALAAALQNVVRREPAQGSPAPRPAGERRYLELLGAEAPIARVSCGPVYRLPPGKACDAEAVAIDASNAELLRPLLAQWLPDVPHRRPFLSAVEDGRAVSVCASVRISETIHCAGVETHPDHRGRGHGARVVAAWATAVRGLGAAPFYSTWWENLASQAVARRVGFEQVAVDFHVS